MRVLIEEIRYILCIKDSVVCKYERVYLGDNQ